MENLFRIISDCIENGKKIVLVTVIRKQGHGPGEPGRRMIVYENGSISGSVGGGAIEKLAVRDALNVMKKGISKTIDYNLDEPAKNKFDLVAKETGMLCGGRINLFFEYITGREKIFLFGAGHIGRELLYYSRPLSFNVTLIDTREDLLAEINHSDKIHLEKIENFFKKAQYLNNSYVVIAMHSHEMDYMVMKSILENGIKPKYLGMIASKKKFSTMEKRYLEQTGKSKIGIKIHSPIGLNLGGPLPPEIALSVIAEIQSVKNGVGEIVSLSEKKK